MLAPNEAYRGSVSHLRSRRDVHLPREQPEDSHGLHSVVTSLLARDLELSVDPNGFVQAVGTVGHAVQRTAHENNPPEQRSKNADKFQQISAQNHQTIDRATDSIRRGAQEGFPVDDAQAALALALKSEARLTSAGEHMRKAQDAGNPLSGGGHTFAQDHHTKRGGAYAKDANSAEGLQERKEQQHAEQEYMDRARRMQQSPERLALLGYCTVELPLYNVYRVI
ncbi:hypothetical protein EXIGLDRAFT_839919 [Exidia glandulosa HHB12029]|uniref:Uncharacterized protein n=1 Tax=Exidia glandulosa HHB12029 TaxID=1314781 RepID=A0A165ER80_EXIGL|nr:hypothetical protein EXIGLDRAFT_839919 [Exidia glandulosa HHB12029]